MPSQPLRSFASDNYAGTAPEILEALAACNAGAAMPYGRDGLSGRVKACLAEVFERDLEVLLVPTGTAANALSLSLLVPPWGAVLCHPSSHINADECGAPEFFTHGAKLLGIGNGADAKIDAALVREAAGCNRGDVHAAQPSCVSITQATEVGSVYTLSEVSEIGAACKAAGLKLHMDGARFANALVSLGCTPAEITWKAGVDVLSFGTVKNGTLNADAVVLFDKSLAAEAGFRRKRAGHLTSKMRFVSAQMLAYLDNALWLAHARHANAMAKRLEDGLKTVPGVEMTGAPTRSNILFAKLDPRICAGLLAEGFYFYHDRWAPGVVRLVASFATTEADVDAFVATARRLAG